jgi:hypothetical protein
MGLPGLLRLAALAAIGLLALLGSGCISSRPRVVDETRVEEWGQCDRRHPVSFTVLCLQMRRPL